MCARLDYANTAIRTCFLQRPAPVLHLVEYPCASTADSPRTARLQHACDPWPSSPGSSLVQLCQSANFKQLHRSPLLKPRVLAPLRAENQNPGEHPRSTPSASNSNNLLSPSVPSVPFRIGQIECFETHTTPRPADCRVPIDDRCADHRRRERRCPRPTLSSAAPDSRSSGLQRTGGYWAPATRHRKEPRTKTPREKAADVGPGRDSPARKRSISCCDYGAMRYGTPGRGVVEGGCWVPGVVLLVAAVPLRSLQAAAGSEIERTSRCMRRPGPCGPTPPAVFWVFLFSREVRIADRVRIHLQGRWPQRLKVCRGTSQPKGHIHQWV